ncbi:hypothetical protein AVEN_40271-1 [Araneus ventricosus]|uniref:Uncharacterized protein n=1 Tax=Araneus ventricosus TaxID=182803 RepID=A0A4Y1ZLG3_ARAVE|nr:hypothetical protein AVEN_40271-1 [Araneus ventricosus]
MNAKSSTNVKQAAWPSGKVSATELEGSRLKIRSISGPVARLIRRSGSNILPLVWYGSFKREVKVQVSSSLSDRGLISRVPSQNSPRGKLI